VYYCINGEKDWDSWNPSTWTFVGISIEGDWERTMSMARVAIMVGLKHDKLYSVL